MNETLVILAIEALIFALILTRGIINLIDKKDASDLFFLAMIDFSICTCVGAIFAVALSKLGVDDQSCRYLWRAFIGVGWLSIARILANS